MALPGQTITFRDGGLGIAASAPTKPLFVGTCQLGTNATIYTFAKKQTILATLGYGPVAEAAAHYLEVNGGTVDVLKTAATVSASNTAVTETGTGPVVTVAGTCNDFYDCTIEVMLGGALGVGRFRYTLDGKQTYSETLTIPAGGTFLIPNTGITATFAAGTYVLATTYAFTTIPATYNSSDLGTAWAVAVASTTAWPFAVFTGHAATASAAATIASAIAGDMTSLANTFRYAGAILDVGEDTTAGVDTAFASFADIRCMAVYSKARIQTSLPFAGWGNPTLPFLYSVAARAGAVKASTSPAWAQLGNLPRVSSPSFDEFAAGETLHNKKINCPRTYQGYAGVYLTNGLLKSNAGSDFKYWQWLRVIDIYAGTVQQGQQIYVNSNQRTLTDGSGKIDARDAGRINKNIRGQLKAALLDPINDDGQKGYCTAVNYAVDETNDLFGTGILQSSGSVVPFAQTEQVATDVGFSRQIAQPSGAQAVT